MDLIEHDYDWTQVLMIGDSWTVLQENPLAYYGGTFATEEDET